MSAFDPKRTFGRAQSMSAFGHPRRTYNRSPTRTQFDIRFWCRLRLHPSRIEVDAAMARCGCQCSDVNAVVLVFSTSFMSCRLIALNCPACLKTHKRKPRDAWIDKADPTL